MASATAGAIAGQGISPILPGRLGVLVGIGTMVDDFCNPRSKSLHDLMAHRSTAAILYNVVQKASYSLILISPVFDDETSDSQEVR